MFDTFLCAQRPESPGPKAAGFWDLVNSVVRWFCLIFWEYIVTAQADKFISFSCLPLKYKYRCIWCGAFHAKTESTIFIFMIFNCIFLYIHAISVLLHRNMNSDLARVHRECMVVLIKEPDCLNMLSTSHHNLRIFHLRQEILLDCSALFPYYQNSCSNYAWGRWVFLWIH